MDSAAVAYTAAAPLCAAAATVITLGHIYRHLLHYAEPIFRRFIVRIIFMVPLSLEKTVNFSLNWTRREPRPNRSTISEIKRANSLVTDS